MFIVHIFSDDGYMHPIHHKSFKSDANGHQPTYECPYIYIYIHNFHDNIFEIFVIYNFIADDFWKQSAQKELVKKRLIRPIEGQAKNVIFYLGDGMSGVFGN